MHSQRTLDEVTDPLLVPEIQLPRLFVRTVLESETSVLIFDTPTVYDENGYARMKDLGFTHSSDLETPIGSGS